MVSFYFMYFLVFFFFNDTATTEIYTLSLHDALPIWDRGRSGDSRTAAAHTGLFRDRSEEHTSELQSRQYLVCRLLLEKKKKHITFTNKPIIKKISINTSCTPHSA